MSSKDTTPSPKT